MGVLDFDKVKTETKNKVLKGVSRVEQTIADGIQWGINNPEKVITIVGAAVALLKASQSLVVSHRIHAERTRIDRTYYDPSTGFHWELCRKATNNDRTQILERKKAGEDVYNILRDLKLIK